MMNSEIPNKKGKAGEYKENGGQKISVVDEINGSIKSDSLIIDVEQLVFEKDIHVDSSITLQRSFSRKAPLRVGERKMNDASYISISPRAALQGKFSPEKPAMVTLETTPNDRAANPTAENKITIMTCNGASSTENKIDGRRLSFRLSAPSWTVHPRSILLFFATLSSIGSILLIYFTLSMEKMNTDENALN